MSYIQVTVPGTEVKHGLKFNQEAIEIFWRNINWENKTDSGEVYAAFYGGLCANERVKQTGKVWTYEEACDFVDTLTIEQKKDVMACMAETSKYKESLEIAKEQIRAAVASIEENEDKKKEPEPELMLTGSESINSSAVS